MHNNALMHLREKLYFKEIGWILLIKICLIIAIGIVFFSHPEGKVDGISITSAHLVGVPTPETRPQSSENRSSYDQ